MKETFENKILGCLLGGLIGDAMGAPVEGWDREKIKAEYNWLCDFAGDGTDDSAIKMILCDAILKNDGYVTADEFAQAFIDVRDQYYELFFTPVRNMLHKVECGISLPVNAGWGNMHSSSSAMSISPMGIINACNPRQAAIETYDVAGLIHSGETGFCRDAACAMATGIAHAFIPEATVESVVEACTAYLHRASAAEMSGLIERALQWAKETNDYEAFCEKYHAEGRQTLICDSRETVPAALALFYLAAGDLAKTIEYGANFGRDADTIATMAGALAGAYSGAGGLRPAWVEKLKTTGAYDRQKELAGKLADISVRKANEQVRCAGLCKAVGEDEK